MRISNCIQYSIQYHPVSSGIIQYPFQSLAALPCVLSFFASYFKHFNGLHTWILRTCFTLRSQAVTTDAHFHAWKTFEVDTGRCLPSMLQELSIFDTNFKTSKFCSLPLQVLVHGFWRDHAWHFACKRCRRGKGLSYAPCAAFTESDHPTLPQNLPRRNRNLDKLWQNNLKPTKWYTASILYLQYIGA